MGKLILDYSKWRCGGNNDRRKLGTGGTMLENKDGYQDCLGQFALQLNKELTQADIIGKYDLCGLSTTVPLLSYKGVNDDDDADDIYYFYTNTSLAESATLINDDYYTTPQQKIEALKKLFLAKVGYEIEVINQPKI